MTKRTMKYNPSFLSEAELIEGFVVRHADLEIIIGIIGENITDSNQHVLVIGPRGSGKTTLVHRVAAEVIRDKELSDRWYPLIFSEESYEVVTAGEFWLEALFHLSEQVNAEKWKSSFNELKKESDEQRLADRALAQLLDFSDSQGKRVLMIVENLNMLFGDLTTEEEAWKIRHTLVNEPRLMLLATATNRFEHMENSSKAMFEMFKMQDLKPLDDDECNSIWEHITGQRLLGERIKPVRILTGGNPRLLTIIAKFSAHRSFRKLLDDLVDLIDDHTEYFKSHLDNLPSIERKVYLALAGLWDASTAREIAEAARLDVNKTSSLLGRLVNRGAVVVEEHGKKTKWYVVAERMYNIYYLMRRRGKLADRVKATVRFLVSMYDPESTARLITEEACRLPTELRRDHCLAYEMAVKEVPDRQLFARIIASTPKSFFESPYLSEAFRNSMAIRTDDDSKEEASGVLDDELKKAREINEQGKKQYEAGNYNRALKLLDKVVDEFGKSNKTVLLIEVALAMVRKGIALGQLNRNEEAITVYDEVVARYADADETALRQEVAMAMFNKGYRLGQLNRYEEEIAVYDEVVTRFADADETALREQVAMAMVNKGYSLGQLNRYNEEIADYDEVVARFADADEPVIREQVAMAMVNKGASLGQLNRYDEEIAVYDEVVARFMAADEPALRAPVATAMVNKGITLGQLNRSEEAITVYDEVVVRFADAGETAIREQVARAMVNKGRRLGQLNRYDEEIAVFDEVIARFTDTEETMLREPVARAMVNKGYRLGQLNRYDEEIAVYNEVVARFSVADETAIREQVAMAMVNKGITLGQLKRSGEEIAVYDEVAACFADADEPVLREQVAMAMVNKGLTLGQLNRYEEEIAVYDEVVTRFADADETALREQVAMAMVNKGYSLGQLNRSEEEMAVYDEVAARFANAGETAIREQVAMAMVNKGITLGQLNRSEEEITAYDEVVARFADADETAIREQVVIAMVNKGITHGELNRSEEAIAVYDEVVARFADNDEMAIREQVSMALSNKGDLLDKLNRYVEAEKVFRKAISLTPDVTWITVNMIKLLLKMPGRVDDALLAAEEIIAKKPEDAELLNEVSWIFYKHNDLVMLTKAESWATKAVTLSPGNSNAHHTLACILGVLGKGCEALESARKYFQDTSLVEKRIEYAIELIVVLAASGQAKNALEMLVNSQAEKHLEPLVVGLKLYLGEDVKTAPEIKEVAKDVAKRIETLLKDRR
jgi:tetratricopeptide (TPR) repeat protein